MKFFYLITVILVSAAFLAGCGWCHWGGNVVGDGTETTDTTPPTVSLMDPADATTNVAVDSSITATFDEDMDPSTITAATFTLTEPDETEIPGTRTFDEVNNIATFAPSSTLAPDTEYTVTITTGVEDLAGNGLASDVVWTFTTAPNAPTTDTTAPTVSSTSPTHGATGVAVNKRIAATFSEGMNESSIVAAFAVAGPGATPVTGTVAYDVTSNIATFTPDFVLIQNTTYTATITTDGMDLAGNALANEFAWIFTTGNTTDTSRPLVMLTNPANEATGVLINTKITATFSEAIDSSTITAATFTVTGPGTTPVSGNVTYAAVGSSATFTPAENLTLNTFYTVTITTDVQDLAGNALAVDDTWTFTTAETPPSADSVAPTVSSTNPADTATDVPINRRINATFSEAMDPSTISTAHFTVTGPAEAFITGTVTYDVSGNIATFVPTADLAPNVLFTASITTGVNDLAGNALAGTFVWTFTTAGAPAGEIPVDLGLLSTFAAVAGAGLTNSNSGGQTTINGNVGLSPSGTCLGDGFPCSALNPLINGTLYANDPAGIAAAAKADLTFAYDDAFGRPPGTTVNDLSGLVLAPGVYTSGSTMSIAVGGTVMLDAQGDTNAVWIFQVGSSLTVNNNAEVILSNGAKASNVYWAIFGSSTLGSDVVFKGNVLAGASNSLGTGSTVDGRMLCRTGQITLLSNTITAPTP